MNPSGMKKATNSSDELMLCLPCDRQLISEQNIDYIFMPLKCVGKNQSFVAIVGLKLIRSEVEQWVSTALCKNGGDSVMVWGCISASGVGELSKFFNTTLKKVLKNSIYTTYLVWFNKSLVWLKTCGQYCIHRAGIDIEISLYILVL